MDPEMLNLFPDKIGALVVDDDVKFLTSAIMMLSLLNFKVATCRSTISALKALTGDKLKDCNVVLINAVKAATCGFPFRDIVERDLFIPVIYFLPLDHKATGDELDKLIRTLLAATFIIRKPFDLYDLRVLWRVIAWRKLDVTRNQQGGGGYRGLVPFSVAKAIRDGSDVDKVKENVANIEYKVQRALNRGRKRKTSSTNPGGVAGDCPAKGQQQMNVIVIEEEEEKDNEAIQQQPSPQKRRGMEANNGGTPPKFQQPHAMDGQQAQSVPPQNPRVSPNAPGKSNKAAAASYTATKPKAPAARPPRYPVAVPPRSPVSSPPTPAQAPPRRPVFQNQQPVASNILFGAMAPSSSAAATAMEVTQHQQDMSSSQMFGPFPYQRPRPPVTQQDLFPPRRRETGTIILDFKQPHSFPLFTGKASEGSTSGASDPAHGGVYGNTASPILQSLNPGVDDQNKFSTMATMHTNATSPLLQSLMNPVIDDHNEPSTTATTHTNASLNPVTYDQNELSGMVIMHTNAASSPLLQSQNPVTNDHNELSGMVTMRTNAASPLLQSQNPVTNEEIEAAIVAALNKKRNYAAGSLVAPQHVGPGVVSNEAAAMETLNSGGYINYNAGPVVAPQHVGRDVAAYQTAAMEAALNTNSFSNCSAGSYMATDQVLGMASNVNELTMAGGAFGTNVAVPSMSPEDLFTTAANGHQLAPGALDNIYGSLMGPQGPGAVMDGNPGLETMFPADPYKNTNMFQVENSMLEQDGQHGGPTGGAATAADATGTTSLIGGERGMGIWDIGAADSLEMLDDFFKNGTGDFMFLHDMNKGRRE